MTCPDIPQIIDIRFPPFWMRRLMLSTLQNLSIFPPHRTTPLQILDVHALSSPQIAPAGEASLLLNNLKIWNSTLKSSNEINHEVDGMASLASACVILDDDPISSNSSFGPMASLWAGIGFSSNAGQEKCQ
jgi:hypothetical protein